MLYESLLYESLTVNILQVIFVQFGALYNTPFTNAYSVNTNRLDTIFLSLITRCKNRLSYFRLSTTRSNDTAHPIDLQRISEIPYYLVYRVYHSSFPAEALHLQRKIADRLRLSTSLRMISHFDFTYIVLMPNPFFPLRKHLAKQTETGSIDSKIRTQV